MGRTAPGQFPKLDLGASHMFQVALLHSLHCFHGLASIINERCIDELSSYSCQIQATMCHHS